MAGAPRRRVALVVPVLAALLALFVGPPAVTRAAPPTPELSDAALRLGSAAASGAGWAASRVLVDGAERAGRAVGGVAVRVVLPSARKVAKPALPVEKLDSRTWRWNGWVSGAAGTGTIDGSFGTFRGEPVGIVGVWADTDADVQTTLPTLNDYAGYRGEMDIAVGALVRGETWEEAAAGAYVTRWTTAARTLRAKRAGKGTTYVRIAHEFNGDWFAWGVNSKSRDAFLRGYRLYASIVRKEFPQARLTWSPNSSNHTDVSVDSLWPGDDVVDVIGPDLYDFDPDPTTPRSWRREANAWLAPGSPTGLLAWQQYAARRGKPVAMPEWGLAAGEDPQWIKNVHDVMARYAAPKGGTRAPGRFVYDCYFNAERKFKIHKGPNASSGKMYASLVWGS